MTPHLLLGYLAAAGVALGLVCFAGLVVLAVKLRRLGRDHPEPADDPADGPSPSPPADASLAEVWRAIDSHEQDLDHLFRVTGTEPTSHVPAQKGERS